MTGGNIVYRDYGKTQHGTMEEFAQHRIQVSAPLLGGMMDPATEYTWSISEDGGNYFRNPTHEEKIELSDAVWQARADSIDCGSDCLNRAKTDGFWQCVGCGAIWTDKSEGGTYGVKLDNKAVIARIDSLIPSDFEDGYAKGMPAEFWSRMRDSAVNKLHRIRERYPDPIDGGRRAIVDVKIFQDYFIHFLLVSTDEHDNIWNSWF